MVLTVQHALENMKHELGGGDVSTELDKIGILNQAGHHLHSMHPWNWTKGRSALLDFRGSISGTDASWTAATKTLTEASKFTNYTFLSGDEITITGGTGATTGTYKVASRVSANAITLSTSLSSTDLGAVVDWTINPGTIDLPDDVRDIIWISSTSETSIYRLSLVPLSFVLEKRGSSSQVTSPSLFYGAVVYVGTPPTPILEIWPSPSANATGAMRIFYRSRWTMLTTDSSTIAIPDFVNDLYLWIVRAYASGYERGDVSSIHERLAQVALSPIFDAAKRSDGMIQPYTGKIMNGAARIWRRPHVEFPEIVNQVAQPT